MLNSQYYDIDEIVKTLGNVENVESLFCIQFATNINGKFESELTEEEYQSPWEIDGENFKTKDGKETFKGKHLFYLSYNENCQKCCSRYIHDCCVKKTKIVKAK